MTMSVSVIDLRQCINRSLFRHVRPYCNNSLNKKIIKNNNKKNYATEYVACGNFLRGRGGEGVFLQFFMTSLGSLNFDPITKII